MFNTITWETFFSTIALITGGYYFITALLLYHTEITRWFKSRVTRSTTPASHEEPTGPDNIMGGAREEATATVEAGELRVGSSDEVPESIKPVLPGENTLINSVTELLNEINTVFRVLMENNSGRAETETLFRTLLLRYPHLKKTSYRLAISWHICEAGAKQWGSSITPEDIDTWWEEVTEKNSGNK